MKKMLLLAGLALAVVVLALLAIPIFFKEDLIALIKREAGKNLNATLEFEDLGLNLFQNFPAVTVNLAGLRLINHAPFAGDTLVALKNFETSINLMSLFGGGPLAINSFTLTEPRLNLIMLQDSSANWDIMQAAAQEQPETSASSGLRLALRSYAIANGHLRYTDQTSGTTVLVAGLNHRGSGDFTSDRFRLRTDTDMAALSMGAGGVNYLSKVHTRLKADFDIDAANRKYTLSDNELRLNELVLKFAGTIARTDTATDLDLTFSAPQTDFKNIISLIPVIYSKDFAALQSSGQLALAGWVKGHYNEKQVPAFEVKLQITEGRFQYPQLPAALNNVNVDLLVNNPGGDPDRTIIDLKKFHVDLGKDPFDATALVQTPVSDPHVRANAKGRLNLDEIRNLVQLTPGTELGGLVDLDLNVNGKRSSLEKNQFDKFQADGKVAVTNLVYHTADLPVKVQVGRARLALSPAHVTLSEFDCRLGNSDVRAHGTLDNVLPFVMKDETLKGTLALQSNYFDLNPWMAGESSELRAVPLPANIEFTMNSVFREISYGRLKLQNVSGVLLLKDRTLNLIELHMNMLGGSVLANGSYSTPEHALPRSFFAMKVAGLSFPQTFASFVTVQKFAPIAQSLQGTFSADFEFVADLDSTLTPVFNTLSSKGSLHIANAALRDFRPLTRMAEVLKIDRLKELALTDLKPSYKIRDGRFYLEPLAFNAGNLAFVISGSNGLDQSVDYSVKLRVPAREMNAQTSAVVGNLLNRKVDLLQNDYVDLSGTIGGSVTDPQVKFSAAEVIKGATAQVTALLAQKAGEKKTAAADSVSAALAKQKLELEKRKQAAADSAKREVERLKEEAKRKLRGLFRP
ncbi:MAG: AsmA family protein [candidate division KSB1 bacterium]|nr:AsmA family protein [candidate division KSB1 bacterium]MDZ7276392.1 AsmA family protein [candidate division KSB1 bacterium]MDZ7288063.1 AsmA family protein [candidate division KSB1 bacterium]MDZ7300162.1 AsmA family protein [candidate division KSB1 bacterium]MDZ7309613.1 AsmA family protein [candidate division KSB1 bacterium]